MKALGALSRGVKAQGAFLEKVLEAQAEDMGTQALMEQMCFISRNAGLYIFSKMITQLLHRMKFYQ